MARARLNDLPGIRKDDRSRPRVKTQVLVRVAGRELEISIAPTLAGRMSLLIGAMFLLLVVTACSGGEVAPSPETPDQANQLESSSGETYVDVSPVELARMMYEEEIVLVNVHVPYEREIEGTDLFIPFDQIEENRDALPADVTARVVVYCRSGSMSATASAVLVDLGYTNVLNLTGGMIAWERAGYSLVDKAR